jgi:hypothetical protein
MGLFDSLKRLNDSFFDGLKKNAVDTALKKANNNRDESSPIVRKMDELDRAARELEEMLKELDEDD